MLYITNNLVIFTLEHVNYIRKMHEKAQGDSHNTDYSNRRHAPRVHA